MNRYGTTKKRLAIVGICECLDVVGLRGVTLPVLRTDELIREHMPNLTCVPCHEKESFTNDM
jgi:hypothetical protein